MPVLTLEMEIRAPVDRVFDLSRSIDLHAHSTAITGERAIAGVTHGLIGMGEEVTWRARHLGVWQNLTSRITAYERPGQGAEAGHFRDSMVRGAFARFDHDHYFRRVSDEVTNVRDIFDYTSPLGPVGKLADVLFLKAYMRRFLAERNRMVREVAEGHSAVWQKYLKQSPPP